MDYIETTDILTSYLGGISNIENMSHCATRLRLKVSDLDLVDVDKIKKTEGVLGFVQNEKELQIIIGPGVEKLYLEFKKIKDSGVKLEKTKEKDQNIFLKATDFIAGSVLPTLPVIVAGGMISAVLVVLTTFFNLSAETGTYTVLNAIYTAAFSFLPIFVGYNAAQKLNVSPMLGALLGAVMVTPGISGAEELSFFGIKIAQVGYENSVLPVIFGVLFLSIIYKSVDKIVPKEIKFFLVPLITMLISVPVTLIGLGPIASWFGAALGQALLWLNEHLGWFSVGIMGAVSPFLIFSGTGSGLYAAIFVAFAENGFENSVMPGMLAANLAAAIAVMTMLKDQDEKAMSLSSGLTAVFGITEPAIFGALIPYKKPFIGASIGGLFGGLFAGITHLKEFAFVSPGLASVIAFMNPDGTHTNLIMALLTMVIGFSVGFVATRLLGFNEEEKLNE